MQGLSSTYRLRPRPPALAAAALLCFACRRQRRRAGAFAARGREQSGTELVLAAAGAAAQPAPATAAARLRAMLGGSGPPRCVNCGDVATARLAEMHGFEMVMTGGSALSLSKWTPWIAPSAP